MRRASRMRNRYSSQLLGLFRSTVSRDQVAYVFTTKWLHNTAQGCRAAATLREWPLSTTYPERVEQQRRGAPQGESNPASLLKPKGEFVSFTAPPRNPLNESWPRELSLLQMSVSIQTVGRKQVGSIA